MFVFRLLVKSFRIGQDDVCFGQMFLNGFYQGDGIFFVDFIWVVGNLIGDYVERLYGVIDNEDDLFFRREIWRSGDGNVWFFERCIERYCEFFDVFVFEVLDDDIFQCYYYLVSFMVFLNIFLKFRF